MTLEPRLLRRFPQLAALSCLHEVTETALVALCAAHPAVESAYEHDPLSSLDQLADQLVADAMALLDALDHYRALLDDRDRLHRGLQLPEENASDLPF